MAEKDAGFVLDIKIKDYGKCPKCGFNDWQKKNDLLRCKRCFYVMEE